MNIEHIDPRMPKWWDILIIVATIITLILLLIDFWLPFSSIWSEIISWIDLGFCILFLFDFFWRFTRSSHRAKFFRKNWIDLVAAIPLVGPLRAGRAIRLLRLIRLTRIVVLARRLLRRFIVPLPSIAIGYLGGITAVVWFLASSFFFLFEYDENKDVKGVEDALWWGLTTLSTVGYGDLYPVTPGGRVIAATTMLLGVGVLASFAGTISTLFVELRERGRRGLRGYTMQDHFLLLGWNEKARLAIEEFFQDPRYQESHIILVAELREQPLEDKRISFVRGRPTREDVLRKASANQARSAIVLSSDPTDSRSDLETALTIMSLRRLNPTIHISAELVDMEHRGHLKQVGCDVMIETPSLAAALLVRSTLDMGVSRVVAELLSAKLGATCQRVPIDPLFIGKSYGEFAHTMIDKERTVLALGRGRKTLVSPSRSLLLEEGDEVFVVYQPETN